ncbi:UNVERIFIED_CONTAM: hypothetical protein H355_016814, partial [Colinus virginianus]
MALGPVRLVIEQRPPSCPQEAWTEKCMVLQASRPCWGTDEVCEMQVPLGSGEGSSALDTSPQQENPMSFIRACCTHRPQAEEEKLRFLTSIRAIFEAAIEDRGAHYRLCVCPLEVAQCIEALLQEEPTEFLDTELRQQAMSAIAAMSSAGLLPEEWKSGLLRACLSSILHLPHQEDMKHRDAAVYTETMEALHHLLQVLVGSAGASVLLELQNILELLLPFTTCQLMATEERAVACIARLLTFSNTCSLPEVQKMVKMIYSSLPSIRAEPALESLGRALLVLASKHPRDVVRSLLGCSPTCTRSAVRSLKVLLCSVGLQRQMEAIQEQGGWDALLSTVTHLQGVQVVARVMRELPGALCVPIYHHLVELLSTKLCSGEMVAMVFFVEMLECTDLGEELHRVVSVFGTHLQSQSVGTQQLVLRGILELSKRQDTARKMLGLLPCITKQLQDADSGARAVALPVLSTLLRLLEGRKLSLAALELAGNLPALFEDESSTVRQLSIRLFLDTLSFVEGSEKKMVRKEVYRSLV